MRVMLEEIKSACYNFDQLNTPRAHNAHTLAVSGKIVYEI